MHITTAHRRKCLRLDLELDLVELNRDYCAESGRPRSNFQEPGDPPSVV